MKKTYKNVILGGGMVAGYAAKALADESLKPGDWAIISAENVLPYERPPLSKGFLAGKDTPESLLINPESFYNEHNIEVLLSTTVKAVDVSARMLHLAGGDAIKFEKLLIATGARPRKLQIPGAEKSGVFYLRSFEDSKRIREAASQGRRAVVLGGGFIGMEVASVLAQRGLQTTLMFPQERVWPRLFTSEMSKFFSGYYAQRGVSILTRSEVAEIAGTSSVRTVVLKDGRRIEADMVVAGIGVTPELTVLQGSGLAVDNGVLVNEFLETSAAGVFAAGDLANYRDVLFDKRRRVEHWDNAVQQGQHAARAMSGARTPFEHVPYFFSDIFDLSFEFWGDTEGADRVIYRGNVNSPSFSAWWLRQGKLAAAFVMRRPDEEREFAQALIKARGMVDAQTLADESRPLPAPVGG